MDITKVGFSGLTTQTKATTEAKKSDNKAVANQTDVISKSGNDAVRSMGLAGVKLARTMTIQQGGKDYTVEGKYKVVGEMPTAEANDEWAKRGYEDKPYKEGETAQVIELTDDTRFVRTYDKENSGMYGSWVMKYDDIKGKTPEQIADEFALPQVPVYMCDVTLEKGSKLRTGECNPLYGWNGGGKQYDMMGQRMGKFDNEREIGSSAC